MNEFYSEQQRALQDRFETRAIADSHVGTIVHDEVQEPEKVFIGPGHVFSVDRPSKIGMLFLDFEKPNRLRLHGTASVGEDDPLINDYPGAEMIMQVAIRNLFVNCPRYVHRYQKVRNAVRRVEAHRRAAGRAAAP